MLCPNCGKNVPDDSMFCDGCGFSFAGAPAPAQEPVYVAPAPAPAPAPAYTVPQAPQMAYNTINLDAPLSTGSFVLMTFLQCIPVVGFILLLVWAFSKNTNTNKKHYARAALIWWLIGILATVIMVLLSVFMGVGLGSIMSNGYYYS
ncbi:MAG: zinc ribbon domain-containing protein [Oscillospiraceae bacterium]|nr:zinc ribbon domain-containing protein [Oscillospiraceae bacterium]